MSDNPDHPVVEYVTPTPSWSKVGRLAVDAATVITVAIIFLAILPFPDGSWNFGAVPQLHLSVDPRGLSFGQCSSTGGYEVEYFSVGAFPLILAKLILVALPAWCARRLALSRKRRINPETLCTPADLPHPSIRTSFPHDETPRK
jgi:hypothetical protein